MRGDAGRAKIAVLGGSFYCDICCFFGGGGDSGIYRLGLKCTDDDGLEFPRYAFGKFEPTTLEMESKLSPKRDFSNESPPI